MMATVSVNSTVPSQMLLCLPQSSGSLNVVTNIDVRARFSSLETSANAEWSQFAVDYFFSVIDPLT